MASVREFINTLEAALAEAGIDDDMEFALALHQQHPSSYARHI